MHHSLSPTNLQAKAIAPRLRLTTKFTVNVASSDSTNTQKFIIMRFLSMRSVARLIRMYTWSKPGLIHYSPLTGLMPIPCDIHKKNLQFGNGKNKKKKFKTCLVFYLVKTVRCAHFCHRHFGYALQEATRDC